MVFEKAVKIDFDKETVRDLVMRLTILRLDKPEAEVWFDGDKQLVRQEVF